MNEQLLERGHCYCILGNVSEEYIQVWHRVVKVSNGLAHCLA
jgi:hypothetical protein